MQEAVLWERVWRALLGWPARLRDSPLHQPTVRLATIALLERNFLTITHVLLDITQIANRLLLLHSACSVLLVLLVLLALVAMRCLGNYAQLATIVLLEQAHLHNTAVLQAHTQIVPISNLQATVQFVLPDRGVLVR